MQLHTSFFAAVAVAGALFVTACSRSAPPSATTPTKPAAATLQPPSTPVKAGQPFTVGWSGSQGADDYIDVVKAGYGPVGDELAYTKTATGNPVTLTAPAEPGTYDVRFVKDVGNREVIARAAVTVVP